MPYYAVLVVVEADDEEKAWSIAHRGGTEFVGEPWVVNPMNVYPDNTPAGETEPDEDPEFGTIEAFDQHPERSSSQR